MTLLLEQIIKCIKILLWDISLRKLIISSNMTNYYMMLKNVKGFCKIIYKQEKA